MGKRLEVGGEFEEVLVGNGAQGVREVEDNTHGHKTHLQTRILQGMVIE